MSATEAKVSKLPACDFDRHHTATYDARTKMGPWAFMCEACFERHGAGLGMGLGQHLVVES